MSLTIIDAVPFPESTTTFNFFLKLNLDVNISTYFCLISIFSTLANPSINSPLIQKSLNSVISSPHISPFSSKAILNPLYSFGL